MKIKLTEKVEKIIKLSLESFPGIELYKNNIKAIKEENFIIIFVELAILKGLNLKKICESIQHTIKFELEKTNILDSALKVNLIINHLK